MELTNEFTVAVPIKEAWELLTDVERIAPCMPGAELTEVEGEEYRGQVKVKVGPITAQYRGKATFVERDEVGFKAVLRAEGRETKGQGNASARITASLAPDGEGTKVSVVTDLTITGRAAQFGRGVLADVSTKLMGQFVACLEQSLLGGEAVPAAGEGGVPTGGPEAGASDAAGAVTGAGATTGTGGAAGTVEAPAGTRRVEPAPVEAVDLVGTAGLPVAKRLAPVLAFVLALLLMRRRRRRRRAARRSARGLLS